MRILKDIRNVFDPLRFEPWPIPTGPHPDAEAFNQILKENNIPPIALCLANYLDRADNKAAKAPYTNKAFDADAWMAKHSDAWEAFKQFTFQAIDAGKRVGAKMVAERVRWEAELKRNSGFKLNNNAVAAMAKRFMAEYPEHDGYFKTRTKAK